MRVIVLAILVLASCMSKSEVDQPLSPVQIREALVGRRVLGEDNGKEFYLYFAPNGVAVRTGANAEYGQWRVAEGQGLCLHWRDEPEQCMPVYQEHIGRYRLGSTDVNVMGEGLGVGGGFR